MSPGTACPLLPSCPVGELDVRQHVTHIGFSGLNLEPGFHSIRRTGVGLARYRGGQFLCVGQSPLENSAGFSLRPNCRIVFARSFDALDVICFRWHCWLLDVLALTIMGEGGPMFAGANGAGM